MDECEEVLQQLKNYLTSPPLLSRMCDEETFYIYLAIFKYVVSAVLVREEEGK